MEEQLKSILKSKPKSKYHKEEIDSSDISSMDEDDIDMLTNQDIEKNASKSFVETELLERITKYLKIDSKIKEKQKEVRECMQVMKKQKEDMEKYIIKYLEDVNEEYIKIDGEGKLIRKESITRGAINNENIKSSIVNGFKKENINIDNTKFINLIQTILEQVEVNRPKKTRTFIKRTMEKKEKSEKKEKKEQSEKSEKKEPSKKKSKQKIESDDEDDIPKYI
jgi:hypothetical protein